MHLIVPFAVADAPAIRAALPALRLPALDGWAPALEPIDQVTSPNALRSTPHECALARAIGLPVQDGRLPWAALAARQAGPEGDGPAGEPPAWAWLTPCHWQLATDHALLLDPGRLALSETESRALCDAMAPWFTSEGLALHWHGAHRWLVRGPALRDLACTSIDRVIGHPIDGAWPEGPGAAPLRRLHSEMQMLLYTHPVNETRAAQGRLPVNAFWLDGAGSLPAGWSPPAGGAPTVADGLRPAALAGDAAAWQAAWQALDAQHIAPLRAAAEAGQPVRLTLCGERASVTLAPGQGGFFAAIHRQIRRRPAWNLMEPL